MLRRSHQECQVSVYFCVSVASNAERSCDEERVCFFREMCLLVCVCMCALVLHVLCLALDIHSV